MRSPRIDLPDGSMAYPDDYFPSFNFTDYQSTHPTDPLPGNSLDNELYRIGQILAENKESWQQITRSDGALANNSVGLDQLDPSLTIGISAATVWATATSYVQRNFIYGPDGNIYSCAVSHVSNVFTTDLAAGKWSLILSFSNLATLKTENLIRNPVFDIGQRPGATVSAGNTQYGPDGHILSATGAGLAWSLAGPGITGNIEGRQWCLNMSCATGLTKAVLKQRIEADKAARAYGNGSKRVTAFLTFLNLSGASVTPQLTVKHPTVKNTFGTLATDISAVSLQTVANGVTTTVAYTFNTVLGTNNGLELTWDFLGGLNAASGGIFIDDVGFCVTPGYPTGIQNGPPPSMTRELAAEQALAERHLPVFGDSTGTIGQGAATSTTACGIFIPFRTKTFVQPTAVSVANLGFLRLTDMTGVDAATVTSLTFGNASQTGVFVTAGVASGLTSGADYCLRANSGTQGNIIFTGAEL